MAVTARSLISLEECKRFLGIDPTNTKEDVELEPLIDAVTGSLERKTRRKLKTRTYTQELYNGTGTGELRLREYPVTAVSAVDFLQTVSDSGVTWESKTITNLVIDRISPIDPENRGLLYWRDRTFVKGRLNIRITYVAGFGSDVTDNPIPENLKDACMRLIQLQRKNKDKSLVGVASRSMSGQTTTFANEEWPKSVLALIKPFMRWNG
jgi:uncharacterized phiE125 gp8 family phage protein